MMVKKGLIVGILCLLMLMPLSITKCKEGNAEKDAPITSDGHTKIMTLKADSCTGFSYAVFGHLGPIWFPWYPLQFNFPKGSGLQLKINGELQNVDLPAYIWLRYYCGIGPSLKDMHQQLGVKAFGICGDLAVIPIDWMFNYINEQPFFMVNDIAKFGQTAWGVTSADFNNDGYMDFAVAWADCPFTHSTISIFYNKGNGSFTRDDVYTFHYTYITDLNAGDYNNDGHIDLLFTYSEYVWYQGLPVYVNGIGKLLLNDGHNHFGNATTVFWHGPGVPYDPENRINPQLASADYDMDGNLDFLVGDNSGKVELYDNNGAGNFTSAGIIHDWGNCSWGLTPMDFDGDGDTDFLVAANFDETHGRIYFIRNQMMESNGSVCFEPGVGEPLLVYGGPTPPCLQALDYDKDGKPDFLVGLGNQVYLCMTRQDYFDIFFLGQLPDNEEGYSDELGLGAFTSADFNNDGRADVCIGGVQGVVRLCLNNYSQQLPPLRPSITAPGSIVINNAVDFTVVTKDINDANVSYWVDWGDGTNSGWVGPFASGEGVTLNHTWTKALSFLVKAKAKNNYGESEWQYTIVIVEKTRAFYAMELLCPLTKKSNNRFGMFSPTINDITTAFVGQLGNDERLSTIGGLTNR